MSTERVGALLRETMEPASAQPPEQPQQVATAAGATTSAAKKAGHRNISSSSNDNNNCSYCVPIKLTRLYREGKLGSPFAKGDDEAATKRHAYFRGWGRGQGYGRGDTHIPLRP